MLPDNVDPYIKDNTFSNVLPECHQYIKDNQNIPGIPGHGMYPNNIHSPLLQIKVRNKNQSPPEKTVSCKAFPKLSAIASRIP